MTLREHGDGWRVTADRRVTYDLRIHPRLLDAEHPAKVLDDGRLPPRRLAVVDAQVWALYGDRINTWLDRLGAPHRVLRLSASETNKTRTSVDEIHREALAMGLGRRDELLGIGGGIILDLVGVAAAELRKGTPYALIPTTLVGLIDAGLGAKRAINQHARKNILGAYHPARLTLLDTSFLATLDHRETAAGLAEVKKVGEMVAPDLLSLLERHGADLISSAFAHPASDDVLRQAIRGLLGHLANDLYETTLRRWPDYGHTISPALEMETDGKVLHGEAVNLCSLLSSALAEQRGHVDAGYLSRMVDLSRRLSLPTYHELLDDPAFLERAVHGATLTRGGHQHWPVPSNKPPGHDFIEATPAEIMRAAQTQRELTGVGA